MVAGEFFFHLFFSVQNLENQRIYTSLHRLPNLKEDLELPEYVAPELGWLGVELAEALPEEFVLQRYGAGQLVAV